LADVRGQQLFFADMRPPCGRQVKRRQLRRHGPGGRPPRPAPEPAGRPAAAGVQLALFDIRRDFSTVSLVDADLTNPWLAWARHTADRHGEARGWSARVRRDVDDALIILLSTHREGEVLHYSEVFPTLRRRGLSTRRAVEILRMLEMYCDDRREPFEDWLARKLAGLAPGIRVDVEAWIRTLHDGGPRRKPRAEGTVWCYLNRLRPILLDWSTRYTHLREVTRHDILAGLEHLHGEQRRTTLVALRSLFGFAGKTGSLFANPTRGIKVGQQEYRLLQPLRPDEVEETTRAAVTPAARVLVALAGIHAARVGTILALQLDDVDLGNRRLTIAGHTRPIDELTHRVLTDWLHHRRERWPHTANPHLIINTHTALGTHAADGAWVSWLLNKHTASLERLRVDRQLEEALACGPDPLHLAAVFDLDEKTAIRYAAAARQLLSTTAEQHPHRQ
jgi:hypothetical protein